MSYAQAGSYTIVGQDQGQLFVNPHTGVLSWGNVVGPVDDASVFTLYKGSTTGATTSILLQATTGYFAVDMDTLTVEATASQASAAAFEASWDGESPLSAVTLTVTLSSARIPVSSWGPLPALNVDTPQVTLAFTPVPG